MRAAHDRNLTIILVVSVVALITGLVILFVGGRPHDLAAPTSTASVTATGAPVVLPTASPTVQEPVSYTVQSGDTLGEIAQAHDVSLDELIAANDLADPNVLQVGQTLIIPQATSPPLTTPPATEASTVTVQVTADLLPTLTPSGPSLIEISQVLGAADLASEMVIVHNGGGVTDLEGWSLSGADGKRFTFPALTLFTDAQVNVHSTSGENTPSDLYWGRAEAVWSRGDLVTLRDEDEDIVDTYIVP